MKQVLKIIPFLLLAFLLRGQDLDPVTWSFGANKVEGNKYKVVFTADIEDGWAIYSQFTPDGGPIPTSFEFEENGDITLIEGVVEPEEKEKKFDEMFEMEVIKIKGKPEFYQILESAEGQIIKGYVTFMCCDDSKCLPPKDVEFQVTLE